MAAYKSCIYIIYRIYLILFWFCFEVYPNDLIFGWSPVSLYPFLPCLVHHPDTQSLLDSAITEFSAEFWLEGTSVELPNLAQKKSWKSQLSMALGIFSIFWAQNFYFWAWNFHFLSSKFPFSEHRILGSLIRAPLQFLNAKFAFSENGISMTRAVFAFSELRIMGDPFRAVFGCRVCIFGVQNLYFSTYNFDFFLAWKLDFPFSEHGILEGLITVNALMFAGINVCVFEAKTMFAGINICG